MAPEKPGKMYSKTRDMDMDWAAPQEKKLKPRSWNWLQEAHTSFLVQLLCSVLHMTGSLQ